MAEFGAQQLLEVEFDSRTAEFEDDWSCIHVFLLQNVFYPDNIERNCIKRHAYACMHHQTLAMCFKGKAEQWIITERLKLAASSKASNWEKKGEKNWKRKVKD